MSTENFYINKDDAVSTVEENFSHIFPYLRIRFFKTPAHISGISPGSILFSQEVKLREINPCLEDDHITLTEEITVFELENLLYQRFGLSAQISRRSGQLWFGTLATNHWSLKVQNDHGKDISEPYTYTKPVYFKAASYGY